MSERGGIVVLDFGGQYTQLIARRIREQQVFSAILPCTASVEQIRKYEPAGIVLSGGPNSVYDKDAPPCDSSVLSLGVPVLGICYGLQWMTHTLGGRVERASRREYGRTELSVKNGSALFAGLPQKLRIWNSHGDHVMALPAGFHVTGETGNAVSAAEDPIRKLYAVQFHPEVRHTDCGSDMLRNFVFEICHAKPLWSGAAFIAETVESIRQRHLCVERWSGFGGRGCAGAPRHRQPSHKHLRGQRAAPEERISRHFGIASRPDGFESHRCRRGGPLPRTSKRRDGPGNQAQANRRGVYRCI